MLLAGRWVVPRVEIPEQHGGSSFERHDFTADTCTHDIECLQMGHYHEGSCRHVGQWLWGGCVHFGTCCSRAWENSLTLCQLLVLEGNWRHLFHFCPPCRGSYPCQTLVFGVQGEHECVALCRAVLVAVCSFRDARAGWKMCGWDLFGEGQWREQLSGPTLIDLIGAARQGWRNARWPGFSRRRETRRRQPGPSQIINVN